MKSKDDKSDNTLESCGCIKAKVLDTGHYCSKIPEEFKVALGFATDCFDIVDLEEHMSRTIH
jgi:hypothetical protein